MKEKVNQTVLQYNLASLTKFFYIGMCYHQLAEQQSRQGDDFHAGLNQHVAENLIDSYSQAIRLVRASNITLDK
jgi:hypothetical protein